MPFKRHHSTGTGPNDTSDSDSDGEGPLKRMRSSSPWNFQESSVHPLRVYILPAKLETGTLEDLINLVEENSAQVHTGSGRVREQNLELTGDLEQADIIVTTVHMRRRLERHVDWELAKSKAIVTPDWLRGSICSGTLLPCGDYAALLDLHDETARQCPDKIGDPEISEHPRSEENEEPQGSNDPEAIANPVDVAVLRYSSRYCCQRPSPLICPNQALVKELDIIHRCRFLEGEERSMLSYARAIAVTYPHPLSEQSLQGDISRLPFLGEKLLSMVEEYVKTGQISEAQNILASTRFSSLSAFNTIHGIGPHTARRLYSLGLRTIEELERYYEITPGVTDEDTLSLLEANNSVNEEAAAEISIKVALALRHDFSQTIPREEVEEINQVVMRELSSIEDGCKSVIVGGYRRGKTLSNDVDIIITHTDWVLGSQKVKGLCKRLVQRLHERGLVTHVMHLSGFHEHNALRTHHWDSLEKALTVIMLPRDPGRKRTYRRLDLIFAAPEVFWTAVVGWTGSTMFQRDLRLWAKQQRGMKFDSSGISRRHDSKLFFPKSEREVFDILGLTFVHPTLRNADA
ncbi:hypothetical protein HYDPIDRAFT_174727 [Hydnomerulius pinastri MD-312]|nr:hypothetical protein HYDPIDRAFT_174727 [Hydnomerulius pinastri MD-312]